MAATVREASPQDAPAIKNLSDAVVEENLSWFKPEPVPIADIERLFAQMRDLPHAVIFVAESDGRLVGELECVGFEPHGAVFILQVHRDSRGTGVGAALLRSLVAWARARPSLDRLNAKVLEPNESSIRLLERNGFARLERIPHESRPRGVPIPEVLYVLDVSDESPVA